MEAVARCSAALEREEVLLQGMVVLVLPLVAVLNRAGY